MEGKKEGEKGDEGSQYVCLCVCTCVCLIGDPLIVYAGHVLWTPEMGGQDIWKPTQTQSGKKEFLIKGL